MNWERGQAQLLHVLAPEVALFLQEALRQIEAENVFDAPGVISGVLGRMRLAESVTIRASVKQAEYLLKYTLGAGRRAHA